MPNLLKAQVIRTPHATRWRWRLRTNPRLAVEQSHIEYGHDAYSDQFRGVRLVEGAWLLISEHRKKAAALKALERIT